MSSTGPDEPTTAPEPTAAEVDPLAGTIEFGTAQNADCSLPSTATTFKAGTPIYWLAHFAKPLAAKDRVTWSVVHDGEQLDSGEGPDDAPLGAWDSICNTDPIRFFGAGEYRVDIDVKVGATFVPVSGGSYTLTPEPSSSAGS